VDRRYLWAAVPGDRSGTRVVVPNCQLSDSPPKDLDLFVDRPGIPDPVAGEIGRDDTARTACVFDDRSVGAVRISYLKEGTLAAPPMRASAGALVDNPTEIRLFE
jgi:hypothetical protein